MPQLVTRRTAAQRLVDARQGGDALRGLPLVARQQLHPQTRRTQCGHRCRRVGAQVLVELEARDRTVLVGQMTDRPGI